VEEIGVDNRTGTELITVDPDYFRPTEVDLLLGDPSKAFRKLGWRHETTFPDLVKEMVEADLQQVKQEGCHRHD
jgi:GDPmannose 4,6-dehydratase